MGVEPIVNRENVLMIILGLGTQFKTFSNDFAGILIIIRIRKKFPKKCPAICLKYNFAEDK